MPRTVKDAKLDSRAARAKLRKQTRPHWRELEAGHHIGYQQRDRGGSWVARRRVETGDYRQTTLGRADDRLDADGLTILDWQQAQAAARERIAAIRASDRGSIVLFGSGADIQLRSTSERSSLTASVDAAAPSPSSRCCSRSAAPVQSKQR